MHRAQEPEVPLRLRSGPGPGSGPDSADAGPRGGSCTLPLLVHGRTRTAEPRLARFVSAESACAMQGASGGRGASAPHRAGQRGHVRGRAANQRREQSLRSQSEPELDPDLDLDLDLDQSRVRVRLKEKASKDSKEAFHQPPAAPSAPRDLDSKACVTVGEKNFEVEADDLLQLSELGRGALWSRL
ncbi:hypothetical protein WMY93_033984 [Mugilogobius chulae]|uniref:Uncharacterized protein n=1 Tax=Mugilogobius chulae TaxID=88201 RepID=A0AAW0MR97_9GOBI